MQGGGGGLTFALGDKVKKTRLGPPEGLLLKWFPETTSVKEISLKNNQLHSRPANDVIAARQELCAKES